MTQSSVQQSHPTDVIKKGYVKIRGRNLGFWTRRFIVLRKPSSRGPCRIDKYHQELSFIKEETPLRSIMVSDIQSVDRLADPSIHGLGLATFDGISRQVAVESEELINEWLNVLTRQCSCARLEREGSRSGSDDDELFDTAIPFPVNLLAHRSTVISGECYLQVSESAVSLYDAEEAPRMKLLHWPLECIHRYGKDSTKFTLEVGPQCLTGEGTFIFMTHQPTALYKHFRSVIRGREVQHKEICQRVKERNLRTQMPRPQSSRIIKKSLTDGYLLLPGNLYDPALINVDDRSRNPLMHSISLSPEGSTSTEGGLEFIVGSC